MRTKELDKHWSGYYYCYSCAFYTGQLEQHQGHDLIFIENRDPRTLEFIEKVRKNALYGKFASLK